MIPVRLFMASVIIAAIGVALTAMFQLMIPAHPHERDLLIAASLVSFYGVACMGSLSVSVVHSYRVHGSLKPALRRIAWVLVVGAIWSALTNRANDTKERWP